jgi:hypothetical protein
MRIRRLIVILPFGLAACSSVLDVAPTNSIPAETAISDVFGARSALTGAYSALQSTSYYGESYLNFTEVVSDNARKSGTLTNFAEADANSLRADNTEVAGMWNAAYDAINRANQLIQKVPGISQVSNTERDEILGEAYFLRALHYHNLVRLWGGVPLRLEPSAAPGDAASITRSSSADVYSQILSDLAQAEQLISSSSQTRRASLGAAYALDARVRLYQQDWAGAEAAAASVEAMGYELAQDFNDLFTADGDDTDEDIFRVTFTPAQDNFVGYYYLTRSLGGRYEAAPTASIIAAFDPASGGAIGNYNPTDTRGIKSIALDGSRTYTPKFNTAIGGEDIHVIRFAEVILIRAEALARLNRLPEAVDEYNRLRVRAGVTVDPNTGRTQADVLASIARERRIELAFEGDRWPDLVRTGEAISVMGLTSQQTLFPIPQREIDTAPGITQNPGY